MLRRSWREAEASGLIRDALTLASFAPSPHRPRPVQLKPYVSYKAAKVLSSVTTPEDVLGLMPDAGEQVSRPSVDCN